MNSKTILILTSLLFVSGTFFSFDIINKNVQQTEEYVLIYVEDKGKTKTVSVNRSGQDAEIITLKVDKKEDYSEVANILVKLNIEGYTLVNSSIAGMNGYLFYSYTMKKSL